MEQLFWALFTVVAGVFGCVAYYFFSNFLLDWKYPARGVNAGRNINRASAIRPWLFL
ncbi:alpha-glucoside ABC transporter permease, partial [Falsihalocynthiibacter sp. S25ZX9]